jgi:hypothetical protein
VEELEAEAEAEEKVTIDTRLSEGSLSGGE